jgi:hypothetical protein
LPHAGRVAGDGVIMAYHRSLSMVFHKIFSQQGADPGGG